MGVQPSLQTLLDDADALPIAGWDFSLLRDRIAITGLPWNFDEIVASHAHTASDLLDIGTGGGEWLAGLGARPARTVATESWPPNIEVAGRRLRPLGITVVATEPAPERGPVRG